MTIENTVSSDFLSALVESLSRAFLIAAYPVWKRRMLLKPLNDYTKISSGSVAVQFKPNLA